MANLSSPYLYNKQEETSHHSGVFDHDDREATINTLLQKRTTVLKDYLAEFANNSASSGTSNSLSGGVVHTLSGIDENVESVLDEISAKMHDDYLRKGMHNQSLIIGKNKQLGNVIKQSSIESRKINKLQKDINTLSGKNNESGLAVKAYNLKYVVFIILTVMLVVTTIISASKSEVTLVEWAILAFFCAVIIYRFFGYLKENMPIWWKKFENVIKGTFI